MAKIKLQATKLENPTVSYISLVERGANRVPFRIIKEAKSENGMINLERIFKRDSAPTKESDVPEQETAQKADETVAASPKIVGVVVEKSDKLPEVLKILKEAGFEVDNQADQDDGTVIVKFEDDVADASIIRMNSHLLALTKDFPEVEAVSIAKAEGFTPGIDMTFGGLFDAVQELTVSDASTEEKVAKLDAILSEASTILKSHISHIPAALFSAAEAIESLPETVEKEEGGEDTTEVTPDPSPAAEAATADPAPAEDSAELIQKIAQELLGPVLERMNTLSGAVDNLGKTVSDISKKSEALEATVAEASEKATAAQAVVKGTVLGAPPKSDPPARTVKAENSDPRSGLFDTAYLPRRKAHIR